MKLKHSLIAQIKALERRKHGKADRYAIIDKKNNIIEKYRLRWTADKELTKLRKDYFEELKIVELDENCKPVVTNKR